MYRTFLRFPNFREKAFTMSYDDGVRQDKRLIAIMKENGLKGTFNLSDGFFEKTVLNTGKGHVTKEEALEIYDGMEVALHGERHLSLAEVDLGMATNDIATNRKNLENLFGKIVKGMAYANGTYDDEVIQMLKACGVQYARTGISTEGFNLPTDWLRMPSTCHHNHPKLMDLARFFVEDFYPEKMYFWAKRPKLFYLWGHSYEFDNDNNWHVIEEFAKYIGNREDIWYATNGEIFEYIQAYDRLEFSMDGNIIHNPTTTDIYMNYLINKKVVIHAGETVKL